MRAAGTEDPKKDCIAYMARLSRPEIYNPDAPRFGVPAWEYSQYEAIYENASIATELLSKKGALDIATAISCRTIGPNFPKIRRLRAGFCFPRRRGRPCRTAARSRSVPCRAAKRDGVDIRTAIAYNDWSLIQPATLSGLKPIRLRERSASWPVKPSCFVPVVLRMMWSCGKIISQLQFSADARREATKEILFTLPARWARKCAI